MSGFAAWIFLIVGPKLVTSRGEELGLDGLAAVVADVLLHPLGGDLAVVVVRGHDVDLLAPLVHGVGHELLDRLRGRRAGAEAVEVAHPALVKGVVEVEGLEAGEGRADGLARGGGDPGVDHVGLVPGRRLRRVLGVVLDGRLRVVELEVDLLAEEPPRGVQLVDGHAGAIDHGLAVDVEPARLVEDAHELDGVGGLRPADDRRGGERRRGGGRAGEETPAGYGHDGCSFVNSCDADSCDADSCDADSSEAAPSD